MTQLKLCALCENKPVEAKFKPFCSKRCADVDLSRWLKGSYVVPGRPADDADDVPGQQDSSEA